MIAVIKTGGKQHKVEVGEVLKIEKLEADTGAKVEFDEVLLVGVGKDVKIGNPFVKGVKVIAEVMDQARAKKVHILKFNRRKHHMKKQGHRQYFTQIKILEIKTA